MKNNTFKQTEIGEIPEDWDLSSVGELVNVKGRIGWRGYTKDDLRESGPLVLGGTNIVDNKINLTKPTFISIEKYDESPEIQVNVEDIIVTKTGNSIGDVGIVLEDIGKATINPNVALFRVNKNKILPRFLYFHLLTTYSQNFLKNSSSSSAQPAINQATLRQLKVVLPRLPEQQQIASVLSSLDDKIQLNRRMNKTLEEIGKALFKHWFVDFEFPNENGEPYKSSGGEMVESELGEIPKEWEVSQLKDFGEIVCGKTPPKKKSEYFDGDVPFIKIPDMHNQVFVVKTEDSLSQEGMNFQKQKTLPKDSICISCIATVGLVCITSQTSQTNQQINSIVPSERFYREYLYFTLSSMNRTLRDYASGGSATLNLNTGSFSKIYLPKPKNKTLQLFNECTSNLFEKVLMNEKESINLAQVRDSLLPRLMSGKLRVN
jgi:type I restriction enzyme S subunit